MSPAEYNDPRIMIGEIGSSYLAKYSDTERVSWLQAHLNQISRAVEEFGSRVESVYIFALMDNFEYNAGYSQKYGLFRTDFLSEGKQTSIRRSGEFVRTFNRDRRFYPEQKDILYDRQGSDNLVSSKLQPLEQNS